MSHFAMLIPSSNSRSRTFIPGLSVPLLLIALLLVTFSPGVSAQYVPVVEIGGGIVDNSRTAGPRWQRVSFEPIISGTHAISLSWEGNAEIQFSIFQKHNAPPPNDRRRIATSSGGANNQVWTGILNPSEQYYLGVWAASGSAHFTASIQAETVVGDPIQIVTQPTDLSVAEGEDAFFSVKATGSDALNYQWFSNNTRINGANSSTLTISSPALAVSGSDYSVVISDNNGSITSETATLTVEKLLVTLALTKQPAELEITEGQDAIFTVTATSGDTLSYQWFADDTAINGATSRTLMISSPPLSISGTAYSVVITDNSGSITSETATLTINELRLKVGLTEQPTDVKITEGQDAIFTVAATGSGKLSYQWFARTTAILDDNTFVINPTTEIPGATGDTLIISSVTLADSLSGYSVVITDDNGSIASDVAILTVEETLANVSIISRPANRIVTADEIALVRSGNTPPESP